MRIVRVMLVALCLALASTGPARGQESADDSIYRVIVPVMGHLTGIARVQWHGGIRITNPTDQEVFVGVTLISGGFPAIAFSLAPGDTTTFEDVAAQAFDVHGRAVAFEIASSGGPVVVESTIAGVLPNGKATPPFSIPAIQPDQGPGFRTLAGLELDEKRRTTVGVCNFGEEEVTVTLAVERIQGRSLATTIITIPPLTLYHAPIEGWFPLIGQADDLSVIVDSPSSSVYAYACVIDNKTQAVSFVAPSYTLP